MDNVEELIRLATTTRRAMENLQIQMLELEGFEDPAFLEAEQNFRRQFEPTFFQLVRESVNVLWNPDLMDNVRQRFQDLNNIIREFTAQLPRPQQEQGDGDDDGTDEEDDETEEEEDETDEEEDESDETEEEEDRDEDDENNHADDQDDEDSDASDNGNGDEEEHASLSGQDSDIEPSREDGSSGDAFDTEDKVDEANDKKASSVKRKLDSPEDDEEGPETAEKKLKLDK